jgi:hypothetical protein
MRQIKTSRLSGAALDYAVAQCESETYRATREYDGCDIGDYPAHHYCTDWAQGGCIIERESIEVYKHGLPLVGWVARRGKLHAHGDTLLIATMRCYVTSKLGDVVSVPDELIEE